MAKDLEISEYLGAMRGIWRSAGWDSRLGCHYERLTALKTPLLTGQRRGVVQARQLYCFSVAIEQGGDGEDRQIADALFTILAERYRADHGAWVFALDDNGAVGDDKIDFYLHAFLIFAFAHYYRATGTPSAIDLAWYILESVLPRLAAPGGGWHAALDGDGRPLAGPLLQNPHMHLLEACLALNEVMPHQRLNDTVDRILSLFQSKLFDADGGHLAEYFAHDWQRDPGEGHRLEPGHHVEWAWLLDRVASCFDKPALTAFADQLFQFGRDHGQDMIQGGLYDEVDAGGQVLLSSKRIWPQTEFVKTCARRVLRTGAAADQLHLQSGMAVLRQHYLRDDGSWHEHLSDDFSRQLVTDLPGSTPYHIQMALLEVAFAGSVSYAA
jgi:mannose-6-phosphate isomerase